MRAGIKFCPVNLFNFSQTSTVLGFVRSILKVRVNYVHFKKMFYKLFAKTYYFIV